TVGVKGMRALAMGFFLALFAAEVAWAGSGPFPDLPVNRWVQVEFDCEGGDPGYAGGCPSGRGWLQLAYDQRRVRVVLFGGSGEWYFNDLWYYDPIQRHWTLLLQDTRLIGEEKDWTKYP